ncbi:MAG TPA: molybdopterin molybdenumtransferase MoeA [Rhizobiales bacterium]|nr:molybdopterin molybdenumtransferase MoeA [Hyphomicrobiales bacterium]
MTIKHTNRAKPDLQAGSRKLLDDCFLHDADRLTHHQALEILRMRVAPVMERETISLTEAQGRILAEPAQAFSPVPAHTNSAVDGYGFAFADYDADKGATFPLRGRSAAGHPMTTSPEHGAAIRIFTGAVVPDEIDCVVMQEDVELSERDGQTVVHVPAGLRRGANIRLAGEDVAAGAVLLKAGDIIRPQDIAGLASIGLGEVSCHKRLRVAVVSTGDEVIRPGTALELGEVYDANAPMLLALVATTGAVATDLGILPDDPAALASTLADTAGKFDVIITSGGASRGEEDHLVTTLDRIGKRHLWQLAIKPGRPMSFGQIGDCVVLGLPGNPVAVFVTFLLYVWPLLRRLGGALWPEPARMILPADFTMAKRKTGRREFLRGILRESDADLVVDKFARDGSGLITGLRAADGLIEIPEDVPAISRGDKVAFIPFSSFGILRQ